jgi:hypothetical protein
MSTHKGKTRIIRSESILSELITFGEKFRVGLPFTEKLASEGGLKKHGLNEKFEDSKLQIPKGLGPRTRANLKGLIVRKQPEEKVDVERHIKYIRRKDKAKVEYNRIFSVYKKELLDKLNLGFVFLKDHEGQEFIVSEELEFNDDYANNKKNTHVINMFLEVFNDYEILRDNLEYYIKEDPSFNDEILPSGNLSEPRNFSDLVDAVERHISDEDKEPLINRLNVFKEFGPAIRKGKGYNGYIALVFEDKGIVAAESIKRDNATYFFKLSDYEDNIMKNKQEVITGKLMIKRFFHTDEWEKKVRRFLNQH